MTTMPLSADEPSQLTEHDLRKVSVVAQCLDDQWVPKEMLDRMLRLGLSFNDVRQEREAAVRSEYLRALINAEQVVINRAFLYNASAVYQDYLEENESRNAFCDLIRSRAILPFLYTEKTPVDEPDYRVDPVGFPSWQRLCAEAAPSCVRLSWDDEENDRLTKDRLRRRFNEFVSNMRHRDPAVFARELGLGEDAAEQLQMHLRRIARFQFELEEEKGFITRADLYKAFVNVDGTTPAEGRFDHDKPFCAATKQLLDLNYNVNLPDALNAFALTPVDSPPRTVLQELTPTSQKTALNADELMRAVQSFAFTRVQEGLYLRSMNLLTLNDVAVVRTTDEWREYTVRLSSLLDDPFSFADPDGGAMSVYNAYAVLARRLTDQAIDRRVKKATARWQPRIELAITVAGNVLKVLWTPAGSIVDLGQTIAKEALRRVVPVVVEFSIRNANPGGADLGFSSEIFRGSMHAASEQLEFMKVRLRELADQQRPLDDGLEDQPSNMAFPEAA